MKQLTKRTPMTMKTTKTLLAQAGALVIAAGLLAGCSSGSSTTTTGPTNSVTGKTTQASATATAPITVPATGGTVQTVTVNGASTTAVVPSGAASAPAGTPLAIVKSGSVLLSGAFPAGSALTVNGVANSGLTVDANGAIAQNVALPVDATQGTAYTFTLPQGSVQSRDLGVKQIKFQGRFYIKNGIVISALPSGISGKIPSNGENAAGSKVTASFGGDGDNGRTVRLTIDYGNGFVLDQTQTIASGQVVFQNFSADASNVPANGIASLSVVISD